MKPLVSILTSTYNAENTITETLQSAIAQTWQGKEIIVVDDGSGNRTVEVARRVSSKDVAIVSTPKQRATAARNHALRLSQGDYFQWLDHDDLLVPDKIERQDTLPEGDHSRRVLLSAPGAPFCYRTHHACFVPDVCRVW